jgi:polyhydroxyalkanoate synthase
LFANVVTSSSLAPTKCATQQSGHAQTRLRKRRCESGAGVAQLPALPCASTGLPSQVKWSALRVGEDLAVTSGAVVYRDAVCEVIQLVVVY